MFFTNHNIIGCTGGASRRIIARTSDLQTLGTFATFSRFPGAARAAAIKIASLTAPVVVEIQAEEIVGRPNFAALAAEFGEDSSAVVEALYFAKDENIVTLRRSLTGRRAYRARKAAASN